MMPDPLAGARKFCAAPMMRYSHAAARRLWRFLCPPALLYTEMIVDSALTRGGDDKRKILLDFEKQRPVALQLGGREPGTLAEAAKAGEQHGADEINLNCGCPSARVQNGGFGALLMKSPMAAAAAVEAVKNAVRLPVTVKCRIAVDDMDGQRGLDEFARAVRGAGADALIVHARRALLSGLSPAQNRAAPPLDYARARDLKAWAGRFPVVLNGGIGDVESARQHLRSFDGAMLGRAIVKNPMLLAGAAQDIYGLEAPSRRDALRFALEDSARRTPREWARMAGAAAGLFYGEPGGCRLRRALSMPPDEARRLLHAHC